MKKSLFVVAVFLFLASNAFGQDMSDAKAALAKIKSGLNGILEKIDAEMARAAKDLSVVPLDSPRARQILSDLAKSNKYIVDCAVVSPRGKMILVEPQEYRKYEGTDISKQAHVIRMHRQKRPFFSKVFRSVEGFDAVDLERPILAKNKKFAGSLSVLLRPQGLLADEIPPAIEGAQVEVWVMELGGRILYDRDKEEIGRNVFTDKLYKQFSQFSAFCREVELMKKGSGSYEFLDLGLKESVHKRGVWDTAGIHGLAWRIIAYKIVPKKIK